MRTLLLATVLVPIALIACGSDPSGAASSASTGSPSGPPSSAPAAGSASASTSNDAGAASAASPDAARTGTLLDGCDLATAGYVCDDSTWFVAASTTWSYDCEGAFGRCRVGLSTMAAGGSLVFGDDYADRDSGTYQPWQTFGTWSGDVKNGGPLELCTFGLCVPCTATPHGYGDDYGDVTCAAPVMLPGGYRSELGAMTREAGSCVSSSGARFLGDHRIVGGDGGGYDLGTWEGDARAFRACRVGHCVTCTPIVPPDAGTSSPSGSKPECDTSSDCGRCSRCESGHCEDCRVGDEGGCTC